MEAQRLQQETNALIEAFDKQQRGQYIDVASQEPYFDVVPSFEESDFTEASKPITPKKIKLKKK